MKKYIKLLFLLLISFGLKAQTLLPALLPNPKSPTSYYEIGWMMTDSGIINAKRDTTFRPRYAGTQVMWPHAGVDTTMWWWDGRAWFTFPRTGGGGGGGLQSFNFTNQNGITGTVSPSPTGPNVNLALGTSLNGIVKGNGSAFGTVVIGSGLAYDGTTLSAGTNLNALISGNGTNFIATTIGAGLSYSTITHTLANTIVNNNQLINGAGYLTNITGLVTAGTNVSITGNGTAGTPYVVNANAGGTITGAGNLAPLFTTSVSVGTINFAFQNPVAFRIFGNPTNATAAPLYFGTDATLHFVGNLLGVDTAALGTSLNFYRTITQIDSFTFTLNTPTGRHDTVRIHLPSNGFVSTLNNGLTLTGTNGQLGGPLVQNTLINGGGFSLGIQGNRFAAGMGAAVAAANNLTLGGDGNLFSITGLTQINAITTTNWQSGSQIAFIFTSTPTLKNNTIGGGGTAPMLLAGGIDYTAAPGDYIGLQYDGSFWHEITRKLAASGGVYVFSSGLTESPATRVKWGGTLTQNTTISGAGFFTAFSGGRVEVSQGASIASANNLTLGGDGNLFSITGSTQINAITTANWQAGSEISFIFTGTPVVKNNTAGGAGTAPLLLAGRVDYTAAVGDYIAFQYDGTNWYETNRKLAGSVSNITLNNGLTLTGTNGQWGGALIQNTTITQGTNTVTFNGNVPGNMVSMSNVIAAGAGTYTTLTSSATSFSGANSMIGIYGFASGINSGINIGGKFEGDVGSGGGTLAYGVYSQSDAGIGVYGASLQNIGVLGATTSGSGGVGVKGDATATSGIGVQGLGTTGVSATGSTTGVLAQSANIPIQANNTTTSTNTSVEVLRLSRQGAYTGAAGVGGKITWDLKNGLPTDLVTGYISNQLTTVTNGAEVSQFDFNIVNAGTSAIHFSIGGASTFMTLTRFELAKGAVVASAGDLTLGVDGNTFHISGTTTINAITTANWQDGSIIRLIFDGSLTVKNNTAGGGGTAVFKLAGGIDFSATADDILTVEKDGARFLEVSRSVN